MSNAGGIEGRIIGSLGRFDQAYEAPERIEVYDNSHIMGTNAVGAMIVAGAEGFVKKSYRKFNIKDKDLTPGDDYGMMREVLRRRFRRLAEPPAPAPTPETEAGATGTDTDAFAYGAAGVPSALISLPLRYMHTTVELIDMHTLEEGARLLAHFAAAVSPEWEDELWS